MMLSVGNLETPFGEGKMALETTSLHLVQEIEGRERS
jgi:hypothetical protein